MSGAAKNVGNWLLVFALILAISFGAAFFVTAIGKAIGLGTLVYDWEQGCKRYGVKPENCRMDFHGLLGG